MTESITSDVEAALAVIEAGDLRQIILNLLTRCDDRTHAQAVSHLIKVATRSASGWTPTGPSDAAEAIAFAEAAREEGYADPSDVDGYLQQASNAFLARDYATALQIFAALLPPISPQDGAAVPPDVPAPVPLRHTVTTCSPRRA